MTKLRSKADPIERQIESAFRPGTLIRDGECSSLVSGLEEVAAAIDMLVATEPARAVALCGTFLAGCRAKADELDDSSGRFGQFYRDLICKWIKSRPATGADPHKSASALLVWMEDDPYAFCHQIEKHAAAAFDKAGLAAFEKQIRERFDAASADPSSWTYRRTAEILREIYMAQKDIPAYIALAEQTELKPEDCLVIAKLIVPWQPNEAMGWVERGRVLDREKQFRSTAAYGLDELHRELLCNLGRADEALGAAWGDFRRHPSKFTYDDLMKFVPTTERMAWHEKALNAASGADLHSLLELFTETEEMERLADLVGTSSDEAPEKVSHFATELAAKRWRRIIRDLPHGFGVPRACASLIPRRANTTTPRSQISSGPETAISGRNWRPNGSKLCAGFAHRITARPASSVDFRRWLPGRNAANDLCS
jgi:hypothetical protein